MTEPHHLTAAEQIHRGTFAEWHVEEVVDGLWPDLVGHVSTDHYDNSVEIFFLPAAPSTTACTKDQAKVILGLGFHRFWLNFNDGTEQYCYGDNVFDRRPAVNPRGGSRSTLRPRLQRRIEDLEKQVKALQGEKVTVLILVDLIRSALAGELTPDQRYPGKPIPEVEAVFEMKKRAV